MEGRAFIDFWSMHSELVEKHVAGCIVWPLILSYRDRGFEVSGAPGQATGKVFSLGPGLGLESSLEVSRVLNLRGKVQRLGPCFLPTL